MNGEYIMMKRWLALIASIAMQTCLGVVYAWSTFGPALQEEHGISKENAGLIFGTCIAVFTLSMVFGGRLQQRHGPRWVGFTGGLLFLAGYLTGSFSNGSLPLALLGFGVLAGSGIGFAYVCPLATGVKWFPNQKGLITGLAVAGFGLGGVFFAKAGQQMLDVGKPVLDILGTIGWVVGIVTILSSFLLFVPNPTSATSANAEEHLHLKAILKKKRFRALFWQIFCGTFGGLLIIGNLKPIGLSIEMSAGAATLAVMLFAVGNATGRVLWGILYDRLGPTVVVADMLLLAIGAVMMGLLQNTTAFYIATLIIAFSFGGCFVLFAARVADFFGAGRISEVYPFVFLGYGIAGLAGGPTGGWLLHISGAPLLPAVAVIILSVLGAHSAWRLRNIH
jgi:OFA family oxalate/formate antiporter-like MFS transporter